MSDVSRHFLSFILRQQNHGLFKCVRQAEFVEDVGVPTGDVSNQHLCFQDLLPYLFENRNSQNLVIAALDPQTMLFMQMPSQVEVEEVQVRTERHNHETKRLIDHRRHSSLVNSSRKRVSGFCRAWRSSPS